MSLEIEAAKNLLTENSCYQCRFLDKEVERCSLHMTDLPSELHCEDYSTPPKSTKEWWSPATLKKMELWMDIDTEAELIKLSSIELEKRLVEDDL